MTVKEFKKMLVGHQTIEVRLETTPLHCNGIFYKDINIKYLDNLVIQNIEVFRGDWVRLYPTKTSINKLKPIILKEYRKLNGRKLKNDAEFSKCLSYSNWLNFFNNYK